MELWKELLICGLKNNNSEYTCFDDAKLKDIVENTCYKVLLQIKQILNDDALSDQDCFFKIEKIISTLEQNDIFCDRHDFG